MVLCFQAMKTIHRMLVNDPLGFGEPLYRLAVLRLQVRMAVVGPLVIDFAVHEEQRVVFIRGVKAMSGHGLE